MNITTNITGPPAPPVLKEGGFMRGNTSGNVYIILKIHRGYVAHIGLDSGVPYISDIEAAHRCYTPIPSPGDVTITITSP